jgi:murein DD-endopeptidase MepM/ murein hydrolase activator NlpD
MRTVAPFAIRRFAIRPFLRAALIVPLLWLSVATPAATGTAPCWAPPVEAPVTDPFRAPRCEWCPGNRGIEYGPTAGQVVSAVAAGSVEFAGTVAGTRYVVVAHDDGLRATYGRLRTVAVGQGATIRAGQRIGTTGTVFYFGLRRGDAPVDPTPFLGVEEWPTRLVPADGSPAPVPSAGRLVCGIDRPGR